MIFNGFGSSQNDRIRNRNPPMLKPPATMQLHTRICSFEVYTWVRSFVGNRELLLAIFCFILISDSPTPLTQHLKTNPSSHLSFYYIWVHKEPRNRTSALYCIFRLSYDCAWRFVRFAKAIRKKVREIMVPNPSCTVHTSSSRRQLSFFTLSLQSLRWTNLYVTLRIHIFPHIIYILCTLLSTLCILTVFTHSYLGINSSLRASILISFLLFHSSWKVIIELWHRSSFPGVLIQNRIHSVPKILYYPK